jgi:iron complex outermembrane receptor protein
MLMLVFGIGIEASMAQCNFKLEGHVEDSDTKEKLEAATVLIRETGKSMLTDSRGDFVFTNLCPGTYHILVTHIHCDSTALTILIDRDRHLDVFLPHAKSMMQNITLESKTSFSVDARSVLSGQKLQETRGMSISEAFAKIPGVVLLQTGTNNAKPVVHGLHGNRVITVNNGIRQEGQQWGNEHAPEIDPYVADKLSLVEGVDALRYGSDALGGVLLVDPKPLRFNQQDSRTEFNTGYFSNNRQYVISAIHERSVRSVPDLNVRIQSTFKKAANVQTPHYRLNNTGLDEINGSLTIGYRKNRWNTEFYISRFQTRIGIFSGSHIGNFSDLLNAIKADQPDPTFLNQTGYSIARPRQEVVHSLAKWRQSFRLNKGKIQLLVSGQSNARKEFDVVRSSTNTKPQMDLTISTLAQDLLWENPINKTSSMLIGVNGIQQQNTYQGRYFIPNFTAFSGGMYALYKWNSKQWELHAGARIDHRNLSTLRLLVSGDTLDNRFRFSTQAATCYAQYKPGFIHDFSLSFQLGVASRSPHVNELLSNGIHHGTATFEQGDPNLRIERSLSIQTRLLYENHEHTVKLELNGYGQRIRNFIFMAPQPNSPVLTNAGAFPRMVYQQTDAQLMGLDAIFSLQLMKSLSTDAQASVLRARDLTRSTWLILMPADRISNNIKYQFADGKRVSASYVSAEVQHVFKQTCVPNVASGITDYKSPPNAYSLFHLHASTTFNVGKHPLAVTISIRNLFNTAYRDYLNQFRYFIDEPGRNIQLRLNYIIASKSLHKPKS